MGDYIHKFEDLLKQQYTLEQVAENLYLNYQSVFNTDEVYKIRKSISEKYGCSLNDVKLIGSAHTGYTFKNNKIMKRSNPKDYDFGIINTSTFVNFFHKVKINNIRDNEEKKIYTGQILNGKLHPKHADKDFLSEIEYINNQIAEELEISRHITVCFYLSEKAFINGLVSYNKKLYSYKLKEISSEKNKIEELESAEYLEVGKMEDL